MMKIYTISLIGIKGIFLFLLLLSLSAIKLHAENTSMKLSTDDGSTGFVITRHESEITAFDSAGGLVLEGSATVKGQLLAWYHSESQNEGVTLTSDDFGKTVTVNSASERTVTLPPVDSGDIGAWFRVVKLDTGKLNITASASDTIADSGGGDSIYCDSSGYANITLQLATASRWVITDGKGQWMTTVSGADETLFNYSYNLRFLPGTGQTKFFNTAGDEIPRPEKGDPYYGQDAHYQPAYNQVHYSSYTIEGDAVVVDHRTGLMWEQKTSANNGDTYTWTDAFDVFISSMNTNQYAGYDDWRLPNMKELFSLISDFDPGNAPYINKDYFPNTASAFYWTSTTYAPYTDYAVLVTFSYGLVSSLGKATGLRVRAVRGGP